MLSSESLTFCYPSGPGWEFPDMQCKRGERLLILGDSGKGKTTLLHLLGGLLRPKSGSIHIADQDIAALREHELDRFRGRHVGIVFQRSHFVSSLSVEDNLLLTQYLAGVAQDFHRIRELLSRLGLNGRGQDKPRRLSQGEQQRVAIARALLNYPDILLADEPTSALDDSNCMEVIHLLEEEATKAESALVIVTHDARIKNEFSFRIEL